MDPVWTAVVELWWIGPAVIGAGAFGWLGLRGQRSARARRLAYNASRDALRTARQDAASARVATRVARAELSRAQAERAAGRAGTEHVVAARRALDAAQRETKAASAAVRARRASLSADRVALGMRTNDPSQLPLARLMAAADAVTARWMEYETDAARLIAFPAMSDARVPATAAFLAELRTTRALRPSAADARITPAQFGAYRDGVTRLARAFDAAETEAWRRARAAGSAPAGPGPDTPQPGAWVLSAQEIAQNFAQTVILRGTEALARATAPRSAADPDDSSGVRTPGSQSRTPGSGGRTAGAQTSPADEAASHPAPSSPPPPVWPVPARGTRPPRP